MKSYVIGWPSSCSFMQDQYCCKHISAFLIDRRLTFESCCSKAILQKIRQTSNVPENMWSEEATAFCWGILAYYLNPNYNLPLVFILRQVFIPKSFWKKSENTKLFLVWKKYITKNAPPKIQKFYGKSWRNATIFNASNFHNIISFIRQRVIFFYFIWTFYYFHVYYSADNFCFNKGLCKIWNRGALSQHNSC